MQRTLAATRLVTAPLVTALLVTAPLVTAPVVTAPLVTALLASLAVASCSPREPRFRGSSAHGEGPAAAPTGPAEPTRPAAGARARFEAAPEPSREGWNDAQIEWVSHDEALRRAREQHRPIVVVMHADWCGHCRNYAHVFEDPRVVERARRMLMVRVDVDEEPEVASLYAADGTYVPRTYFVGADGGVLDVDARRARFSHFFDEADPGSILAGMDAALAR